MSDSLQRLVDTLADRYTIEREIGQGGMATVYLAEDRKHRRKVAVKVLRPDVAAAVGEERFLREIEVTAGLSHPNILTLIDSGEAGGFLYYVMPFVEGESLRDRLDREGQLPIDEALQIAHEVAATLDYAHRRNVIHRDIKPDNILLTAGTVIVADFGIAKALSDAGGDQLTQTGVSIGTPAYMSPEQAAASEALDGRSDQYSLACVLYEMLAGDPPFTGPTAQAILVRHATDMPHSLRAVRSQLPPAAEGAINRALSKAPIDRFATTGEFARALREPEDVSASSAPRQRSRALAGVVVAALVLGGAAAIMLRGGFSSGSPEPPKLAVLPFDNAGAPDDDFFADGVTEEVTSRLAEISGLRVVSRSSAKRFKGLDTPIAELAEALQVDFILAGTVRTDRSAGGTGQVRVTPQLIRATDDTYVWTDQYDAQLTPGALFAVQADIAEQVAGALSVTLLEPERAAVRAVPTEDPEAWRLYQLGRFQVEKRTADGLLQAQGMFRDAIARDSAFAAAYAGLADALALYSFQFAPNQGLAGWAPAEEAARRALALNPDLAEAYASLGLALMYGRWDWAGARRAFDRAVAYESDYAQNWYWFAELDIAEHRLDDALVKTARAREIDPLSAPANALHGIATWFRGDRVAGADMQNLAIELQPAWPGARWWGLLMQAQAGRLQRATTNAERFFALTDPAGSATPDLVVRTVDIWTSSMDLETTVNTISEWAGYGLDDVAAALAYAVAGFSDSAFARLDLALSTRNEGLPIAIGYLYESIGGDERWQDVLNRMGLSWE